MATGTGSVSLAIVSAAGVGGRAPMYSNLFPGASASIAHARILKGERRPEEARNFHEILKEQT